MFQQKQLFSCAVLVLIGLLLNIQRSQCEQTAEQQRVEPVVDDDSVENQLFSQFTPSTKLRILQIYLDELKRKEFLAEQLASIDQSPQHIGGSSGSSSDRWPQHDKRSSIYLSSLKRNTVRNFERKRPGWELAYGKRKRSVDNINN